MFERRKIYKNLFSVIEKSMTEKSVISVLLGSKIIWSDFWQICWWSSGKM